MKNLSIELGARSYDVLIGPGLIKELSDLFNKYGIRNRIFLVANPLISGLFGKELANSLSHNGYNVSEIQVPDGEQYKNLQTVEKIYTDLIDQGADRTATLVALGGGVTGDIVGFVAATFLRGVRYVQVPTTLLSQVDSSVGGKTGVNHRLGKNMIGAFYQPHLVCIDTETLLTLPQREFQSGLYEVVKYGLIGDEEFFNWIESSLEHIQQRAPGRLADTIGRCCQVKATITSDDETEQDLRRVLNFGHTFGHALEAATEFQLLTHGEAVGYGMLAATHLSMTKGYLDSSEGERIVDCIGRVGPLPPIHSVSVKTVLGAMRRDKKRIGDRNVFVLLKSVGNPFISQDVDEEAVEEALAKAGASSKTSTQG